MPPSEDLVALRQISQEFAQSNLAQQKIVEQMLLVVSLQSKAITQLIDVVQELVVEIRRGEGDRL